MFKDIIMSLREDGLSIQPDFLDPELCAALQQDLYRHWQTDQFKQAGIGHKDRFVVNNDIRNDFIAWLDDSNAGPSIREYLTFIEQLRLQINRELQLGLFDFEGMMAIYPKDHYYKKHLDQFQDTDLRTLTVILYLNEDWHAKDGGQLRIYNIDNQLDNYIDVLPKMGSLVCFLSSRFPHEVLAAQRQRMSITGWFKRRDLGHLY